MQSAKRSERLNYMLLGSIGAIFGGVIVLVASRAIPRMMSKMMSGMMQNMMDGMNAEGCNPSEF